jgi:ABC-type Fe3+-siderophore transport system permease subunit
VLIDPLAQLLGLSCVVSGVLVFVGLMAAAALRLWLERLAANAAESMDGG